MAKVICALPNASDLINGIKFVEHKLGMISEEIEDEVAEVFLSIKGYVLAGKNAAKELAAQSTDNTQGAQAPAGESTDASSDAGAQSQTPPEGGTDPAAETTANQ